jgi:hypothetical protein
METGFDIPDAPGVVAYLEETMLKDEVAKGARVVAWASSCESPAQGRPLGRRGVSGMASAAHACILRGARRSAAERQAPRTPSQHTRPGLGEAERKSLFLLAGWTRGRKQARRTRRPPRGLASDSQHQQPPLERDAVVVQPAGCCQSRHSSSSTLRTNPNAAAGFHRHTGSRSATTGAAWEIASSLRDEEWGAWRFMAREPSGTLINVVSHGSG